MPVRVRAVGLVGHEMIRVVFELTPIEKFRIGGGRDDIIAGGHFQKETRDLPHLLADHDIAFVIGVVEPIERINLVSRGYT